MAEEVEEERGGKEGKHGIINTEGVKCYNNLVLVCNIPYQMPLLFLTCVS